MWPGRRRNAGGAAPPTVQAETTAYVLRLLYLPLPVPPLPTFSALHVPGAASCPTIAMSLRPQSAAVSRCEGSAMLPLCGLACTGGNNSVRSQGGGWTPQPHFSSPTLYAASCRVGGFLFAHDVAGPCIVCFLYWLLSARRLVTRTMQMLQMLDCNLRATRVRSFFHSIGTRHAVQTGVKTQFDVAIQAVKKNRI